MRGNIIKIIKSIGIEKLKGRDDGYVVLPRVLDWTTPKIKC